MEKIQRRQIMALLGGAAVFPCMEAVYAEPSLEARLKEKGWTVVRRGKALINPNLRDFQDWGLLTPISANQGDYEGYLVTKGERRCYILDGYKGEIPD